MNVELIKAGCNDKDGFWLQREVNGSKPHENTSSCWAHTLIALG